VGVVGVNPDPSRFSFHIGKVRRNDGTFSMADVFLAAEDCVRNGANIISLAISCDEDLSGKKCYKKQWDYQLNDIYNHGVLIIGSAGNTGSISEDYPGMYQTVMSVSAVDEGNLWFNESTRNNQVEIAAPGA
jgi:hypothetical protein